MSAARDLAEYYDALHDSDRAIQSGASMIAPSPRRDGGYRSYWGLRIEIASRSPNDRT
jgi:hypothetical protein